VEFASLTQAQVRWFHAGAPVHPGVWCEAGRLVSGGEPFFNVDEIGLRGRHNVENILAAACAAQLAGAPLSAIADGIRSFPGVEHRIEFVGTLDGVSYYNDSKATNVDATVKALESFDGGLWVILGGKDKNSDYTTLRSLLHTRAKAVLLIGAAAEKIESHLAGCVRMERCGDLRTAILTARAEAQAGDTVLLAPACASFDQFTGYEQRGRIFKEIVHSLKGERS
jgi:UDP-N-acetylmuramoylalanine--D-glutamate ligase